ncbi:hypothetical protein FOYG_16797 [Fusarium oxysporum NRRL 32931]|uniref:Uncharacterized protein n=1 Tax=Fusarium oxysporum NRRL 32931 TaxID=660029 RepID=W9HIQ4_FUSOX|nr:hypothetical protein FOYG_16797 [Fusarium oxysporum NRRL 32931]
MCPFPPALHQTQPLALHPLLRRHLAMRSHLICGRPRWNPWILVIGS